MAKRAFGMLSLGIKKKPNENKTKNQTKSRGPVLDSCNLENDLNMYLVFTHQVWLGNAACFHHEAHGEHGNKAQHRLALPLV